MGVVWVGLLSFISETSHADQLRLVEREDGNEVEILGEREDAFIVKIPKGEVKMIKREALTEIKLWKEKKILWEDKGDYLVISLPKERIIPSLSTTVEYSPRTIATPSLEEGLAATGTKGRTLSSNVLTGSVTGRVFKSGRPLAGCRVRLVAIEGPGSELTRLLGGKSKDPPGPTTVEATTGEDGVYLFEEVPIGDYDISWLPPDSTHWLGWLSEKPDVTVLAGELIQRGDIEL
ncbi:MAG: carboxypeptidase regulatory-like domain-containing protein [Candidatus Omnitrophica bacterium]|nr:carboxypeptidase regulatory-like domain-containing protein [Candidatus Omnitrophota bacterium]